MEHKVLFASAALLLCLAAPHARAQVQEPQADRTELARLMEGYLRNDLDLQMLSSKMRGQLLSHEAAGLEQGIRITLSTGTVTITTGKDASVTFSPSASLSVPQASNLALTAGADVAAGREGSDPVTNISLSLSADIISASGKKRELALRKADRELLVAQRALQNGFLSAETAFYEALKGLYNLAANVVKAQKDLYDDQLSFEQIKAQGYRTSSSRYRTAQMQVLADERTVQSARREFEREVRVFASKCGVEYAADDPADFLPKEIPEVEPVRMTDFDRESFAKIEGARWTQTVNELTRQAGSAMTLRGSAGYTFNNARTKGDSVDAGASFTWNGTGLTASAGVSLPVRTESGSASPVYTLGLSFDPLAFRLAALDSRLDDVQADQDALSVQAAEKEYRTAVVSQRSQRSDLLWQKQTYRETYELYDALEADMATYYRQGIISESEWRTAQVNKESARIKCLVTALDLIIYNNGTKLLFCRDGELAAPRPESAAEEKEGE